MLVYGSKFILFMCVDYQVKGVNKFYGLIANT